MTPKEQRNELLAAQLIKHLNRRNMGAYYCPTGEEAVNKVSELIADGSSFLCSFGVISFCFYSASRRSTRLLQSFFFEYSGSLR